MNRWLQGRYGFDPFSRTLIIAGLIFSVVSWFFGRTIIGLYYALRGVTLALMGFAVFRTFSRNIYARQQELARYLTAERAVRNFFQRLSFKRKNYVNVRNDRRNYKYLQCPQCSQKLRVPKGKGRIRVTCAKCGNRFEAKS